MGTLALLAPGGAGYTAVTLPEERALSIGPPRADRGGVGSDADDGRAPVIEERRSVD